MLSVICPIYNEEKYIEKCIDSILAQDYPQNDLEVIFIDGMSTDRTREIVADYAQKFSFIKMIDNLDRIVPPALNKGVAVSNGDIIIRLDAHATYEPNYFSVLVKYLQKLNADNVGSVCRTDVLNKTPKTLAIKEVLSSKLGVGNSTFRTGINKVAEVDTVPFGCWNKNVFEKIGYFNEKLIRNQDIELNKRIKSIGGKIYIVPETFCTYYARETYKALIKNNYGNGKWNILTVFYTNNVKSLSVRHFIPLCFVLSLIVPALLSVLCFKLIWLAVFSLTLYLLLVISVSLRLAFKKRLNPLCLIVTYAILHLSYGFGSLVAIVKLPFIKK